MAEPNKRQTMENEDLIHSLRGFTIWFSFFMGLAVLFTILELLLK
ncbi:MAG: hypothetical protein C0P64_003505 [Bacillota bacterium]|jgi:hypothetical protein